MSNDDNDNTKPNWPLIALLAILGAFWVAVGVLVAGWDVIR